MPKTCPTCKVTKEVSDFSKNKSRTTGIHSECKVCQHTYNRRWMLKRRFNLTDEEIDYWFSTMAKGCAICHTPIALGKGNYAFDHDHETDEVRGVLCPGCNTGLGLFKENIVSLERAALYVQQHKD